MTDNTTSSFSPFYTHFVLETPDGWRYHLCDYLTLAQMSLARMADNVRLDRELHFHISQKWENDIEVKYRLPPGHLRGMFDIHKSINEVNLVAHNENLRLRPSMELNIAIPDGIPIYNTHVNFVLTHKVSPQGLLMTEVLKEVVIETRARCTCLMCIPMPLQTMPTGRMYTIQRAWTSRVGLARSE